MNVYELDRALRLIEHRFPQASVLYARIILALYRARDQEMLVSDLSDQLGKGRDNSTVQKAVARLAELGIAKREREEQDQRYFAWLVRLTQPASWPLA